MTAKIKWLNLIQNLAFWTISFGITLRAFTQTETIRPIDLIYSFLFHIPFVVMVSINIYYLVPAILKKKAIWVYLLFSLVFGYGVALFLYNLAFGLISELLFPNFYLVGLYTPLEIFGIYLIYLTISTLIELSKTWFNLKETERKFAELEQEKTLTELKALRAQINPHFLFNNLNTIYGEALKKSDKAPEMILKLSGILRYIVENMDKDSVPLTDEINYLTEFIDMQKSRLTNPHRVLFKHSGKLQGLQIAPLLLINFVENCFKHGSTSGLNDRIIIEIDVNGQTLAFRTKNPVSTSASIERTSSGTGISNVKKRLSILYPDRHILDISENNDTFTLSLTLTL